MIPASLSQHEWGNMMRLRHHKCFVWRLRCQAFEIHHDWSFPFIPLIYFDLIVLAFPYSMNLGLHLLGDVEEWFTCLCFKVGHARKKAIHKDSTHVISLGCWCFSLPMKEVLLHYQPVRFIDDIDDYLYTCFVRGVFKKDSVQHFKAKNNRFCLWLLLSIVSKNKNTWGIKHLNTQLGQKKHVKIILQTYFLFGCFFHVPKKLV